MTGKYLVLFAGLALLVGCSETSAIKDAVRDGLKDPDSAKFGEVSEVEGTNGKYACATVNARNSMGGYTGDSQMYLKRDDKTGWVLMGDMEFVSTHEQCKEFFSELASKEKE